MSAHLLRLDLSATNDDFEPTALEPGVPMLDAAGENYRRMRRWLETAAAEPVRDGPDEIRFYVRDEHGSRLTNVACRPATRADLAGPCRAQFERLRERLKTVKPASPTEKAMAAAAERAATEAADGGAAGNFFVYREAAEPWRLVCCWGYRAKPHRPPTAVVCSDPNCKRLFLSATGDKAPCPTCRASAAAARRPRVGRRLMTAGVLAAIGLTAYGAFRAGRESVGWNFGNQVPVNAGAAPARGDGGSGPSDNTGNSAAVAPNSTSTPAASGTAEDSVNDALSTDSPAKEAPAPAEAAPGEPSSSESSATGNAANSTSASETPPTGSAAPTGSASGADTAAPAAVASIAPRSGSAPPTIASSTPPAKPASSSANSSAAAVATKLGSTSPLAGAPPSSASMVAGASGTPALKGAPTAFAGSGRPASIPFASTAVGRSTGLGSATRPIGPHYGAVGPWRYPANSTYGGRAYGGVPLAPGLRYHDGRVVVSDALPGSAWYGSHIPYGSTVLGVNGTHLGSDVDAVRSYLAGHPLGMGDVLEYRTPDGAFHRTVLGPGVVGAYGPVSSVSVPSYAGPYVTGPLATGAVIDGPTYMGPYAGALPDSSASDIAARLELRLVGVRAIDATGFGFRPALQVELAQAGEYRLVDSGGEPLADWRALGPQSSVELIGRAIPRVAGDVYELFVERRRDGETRRYQAAFKLTMPNN